LASDAETLDRDSHTVARQFDSLPKWCSAWQSDTYRAVVASAAGQQKLELKGSFGVTGSLSVSPSALSAGANDVAELGTLTGRTGAGLTEVMSGLAAAAGDADLSGALQGADGAAAKTVGELMILLAYVAESLESCAANYRAADSSVIRAVPTFPGHR
jgi:hypothetical protein